MMFNPEGTPIVVLNGRSTLPTPSFLYGMAMAKGDADTRYFSRLPPPR